MPSSTQVAASPLQDGVDQTLVAALPDHESGAVVDTGRGRGVGSVSGGGKVPEESWMASKSASDDKTLKRVARSAHSLTVVSGERAALWRGLYRRREGEEGVAANGALYWETVKTCFGSKGEKGATKGRAQRADGPVPFLLQSSPPVVRLCLHF